MALQDRTEPATPRKREEVREQGRVAKSTDISSALTLLGSLLAIRIAGPYLFAGLADLMRQTFMAIPNLPVTQSGLPALTAWYGTRFALLCLPVLLVTGAMAFTTNVLQIGLKVTPKALKPDLSKLDPIKGIGRFFTARSLVELGKTAVKLVLIGYFVYTYLKAQQPALLDLSGLPPAAMGARVARMCWDLALRGCIFMLVIGILDYIYQRFQFENSIKMSHQEIKDEFKRSEGDPRNKSRVRQRQRELARHRMIHDVAQANVVITNPTHLAIALKYDSESMTAPTVIAKGQRLVAQKIKDAAAANNIPVVENKPLARLLYKAVEVGQQIPEDLYQAVAEILAYVYQLNQRAAAA